MKRDAFERFGDFVAWPFDAAERRVQWKPVRLFLFLLAVPWFVLWVPVLGVLVAVSIARELTE